MADSQFSALCTGHIYEAPGGRGKSCEGPGSKSENPDSPNPPHSLIFLKPNLETLDFFDLLWIVGIADFILKYITIALKCLVVALPKIILAVKSKVGTGCGHQAAPITHTGNSGHLLEEERVGVSRGDVIVPNEQSPS